MERGFFHTTNTAFDLGSATVPVAPFGVPPNGPETGADARLEQLTAITNAFGQRQGPAADLPQFVLAIF
jgi:hypothetical protein